MIALRLTLSDPKSPFGCKLLQKWDLRGVLDQPCCGCGDTYDTSRVTHGDMDLKGYHPWSTQRPNCLPRQGEDSPLVFQDSGLPFLGTPAVPSGSLLSILGAHDQRLPTPETAINYNAIKCNRLTPSVKKTRHPAAPPACRGRIYKPLFFDPDCTFLQSQIFVHPRYCETSLNLIVICQLWGPISVVVNGKQDLHHDAVPYKSRNSGEVR